jgi:hypothetical protein
MSTAAYERADKPLHDPNVRLGLPGFGVAYLEQLWPGAPDLSQSADSNVVPLLSVLKLPFLLAPALEQTPPLIRLDG